MYEDEFTQVVRFNQEVLGIEPRDKGLQDSEEYSLSWTQMSEEVGEYLDACQTADYVGAIDAVIDNIVFSMGVLYKLGLTRAEFAEIFHAVMSANMQKKIGVKKNREGFAAKDAVKPEGFVSPEKRIAEILGVSEW